LAQNFRFKGMSAPTICALLDRPLYCMPYDFATDSFRTKEVCSTLSSRVVQFYSKNGHCFFEPPPPVGSIRATYALHLRLIGMESM